MSDKSFFPSVSSQDCLSVWSIKQSWQPILRLALIRPLSSRNQNERKKEKCLSGNSLSETAKYFGLMHQKTFGSWIALIMMCLVWFPSEDLFRALERSFLYVVILSYVIWLPSVHTRKEQVLGLQSTEAAYLLLTQQPLVWFLAFPRVFFLMLLRFIDASAQKSGQRLDIVNRTHLVLASGKRVLQKRKSAYFSLS